MNEWDRVEKTKKAIKESDIRWEYIKMAVWILLGSTYLYFVFWG
jgi:hypothetical protein|tara:strand:- start:472 stop:603 length:132 start_codon:yes stop_codon:yes gene_type:complete